MPAGVPSIFAVRRSGLRECDTSRERALTGEERYDQDAVSIGNIGVLPIYGFREGKLAVIASHVPFVEEDLFGIFQSTTQVSVYDQLALLGDLDQDVLRLESRHGSRNRQVVGRAIHIDRNELETG